MMDKPVTHFSSGECHEKSLLSSISVEEWEETISFSSSGLSLMEDSSTGGVVVVVGLLLTISSTSSSYWN